MALDSELSLVLHSSQHFPMAAFRSSQKSDRNSCWSVYRAVQAGNRSDMLLGPLGSLVTPGG